MPHRLYAFLPVALVVAITLLGGLLNDASARGQVVDESTGEPLAGVRLTYGIRSVFTDAEGHFVFEHLPRSGKFSIQLRGYDPLSGDAETTEVKLHPFAISLQVNEKDSGDPPKGVAKPEIRQGDVRLGAPGTENGSVVAAPYPQIGSQLLICAPDHDSTTIPARGGAASPLVVTLAKGTQGCPPLASPAPAPAPSGVPLPAVSPTPSPTPSAPKSP